MSRRVPLVGGRIHRTTLATLAVATLAAVVALVLSTELFPYHSVNHDEGVYLQQARLLLGGELWFTTDLPESFRWWFFVRDGPRLYPKYAPVPAAVFALGMALGAARLSLALVAFAGVLLVGLLTAEAFDRRTGVVAAGVLAATPLFLVQSAVFLPYATTTALNLAFALGYVRSVRATGVRRYAYATLAGVAVGLAFFSRPYTAVLFALPFVLHASYGLLAAAVREEYPPLARAVLRNGVIALLGLAGVGLTLYYNALTTGDPFVFPYQAFAPADGIGFGHRQLLGYERTYTPELAVRANAEVLGRFLTRWSFAPPLGAVVAGVGFLVTVGPLAAVVGPRARARREDRVYNAYDESLRATYAGVALTVVGGNVLFWGNLNVLGNLAVPDDGLVASLGTFYHLDLLLPFSAFAAAGLVWGWRRLRGAARESDLSGRETRLALAVVLVAGLVVGGVVQARAVDGPLERNQRYTDGYEAAYAPFEARAGGDWAGGPFGTDPAFDRAVVFVPQTFGGWLGHPFQSLQNDPGLDGPVVYALDRSAAADFAVLDAYSGRTPYRYTYRGEWEAGDPEAVVPALQPLEVREGSRLTGSTTVGVVGRPVTARLAAGDEVTTYDVRDDPSQTSNLTVPWVLEPGQARVTGERFVPRGDGNVSLAGTEEVALTVTFVQEGGATLTYRQELSVESVESEETVRVVWPPETRVCRLTADCGRDSTYVPGGEYVEGVVVSSQLSSD